MKCPICGTENKDNAFECVACGHRFKIEEKDISWVESIDFTKGIEWDLDLEKPDINSVLDNQLNKQEEKEITIIPTPKTNVEKQETTQIDREMFSDNKKETISKKITNSESIKGESSNQQRIDKKVANNEIANKEITNTKVANRKVTNKKVTNKEMIHKESTTRESESKKPTNKTTLSKQQETKEMEYKAKQNRVKIDNTEDDGFDEDFAKKVYGSYTKKLLTIVGVAIVLAILAVIVMVVGSINKNNNNFYTPNESSSKEIASNESNSNEDTSNEQLQDTNESSMKEDNTGENNQSEDTSGEDTSSQGQLEDGTIIIDNKYEAVVTNGTIAITKYLGNEAVVQVPATYNQTPIKTIEKEAFKDKTSVTSIIIEEGVEIIGVDAFYGCSSLTSISLPASIKDIGEGAFNYCGPLTILCKENTYASSFAQRWNVPIQIQP